MDFDVHAFATIDVRAKSPDRMAGTNFGVATVAFEGFLSGCVLVKHKVP